MREEFNWLRSSESRLVVSALPRISIPNFYLRTIRQDYEGDFTVLIKRTTLEILDMNIFIGWKYFLTV